MRTASKPLLLLPGLAFLVLFFVLPSLVMLLAPPGADAAEVLGRVGRMLTDPYDLRIIGRTVGIAAVVTLVCVVLGFPEPTCWPGPPRGGRACCWRSRSSRCC
jgi:putative spermidine/putrescine transport system permease protein